MQPNPLFSVLIANYNNGKYLEEALQSVFAQTYTNWEIILVDDASTDNSNDIYQKYNNDSRIHIYYNGKNYGCGYTKHRCVELANGEICGFLDPDDVLANEALAKTVKTHCENQSASLVYTDFYYCNHLLNTLEQSTPQTNIPQNTTYLEYGKGAVSQFATFKKKKYLQTEGINPEFKRAVDQDLYFKLEETGSFVYLPTKLYYYRTNTGNNLSLGINSKIASLWHIIAATDSCRRRNKDIESIVLPYYDMYINRFVNSTKQHYNKLLADTYNSFSFKIGKLITFPYRLIKRIISK